KGMTQRMTPGNGWSSALGGPGVSGGRSSLTLRSLCAALSLLFVFVVMGTGRGAAQPAPQPEVEVTPGGFLETATTGLVRPRLTQSVLQALLPARGGFTFPAPYGTAGVRLT